MPSMSSPICLCLTYATIGLVIFLPAINAGVHGYNRGPDEAPEYSHVDMVISKREIDHDHEGIANIFTAENSTSSHKTHCEMLKAGDHSPIPSSPLLSPRVARRKRPCSKGHSGDYSCHGVDLLSSMSLWELTISHGNGRDNANDIWGWTDMRSGREFVLVGLGRGTAFVEITNPINPTNLGVLPGTDWHDANPWRDIKVYQNHALIVSEYNHHGMQVFDLKQLLNGGNANTVWQSSVVYRGFGNAHNIVVNEEMGYAFAVGTNKCRGGLYVINVRKPTDPKYAGCFSGDGYTHDAHCVTYRGSDIRYNNKQICFACNENSVTIVSVHPGETPYMVGKLPRYYGYGYTHQGWLTDDHNYFIFGDELDEQKWNVRTTTYILKVTDLEKPEIIGVHRHQTPSIDHNMYVRDGYLYQANYDAGLRVLELSDVKNGNLREVAYFDTFPGTNSNVMRGAWSVYPYFPSGSVVVSGIEHGLFVLSPDVLKNSAKVSAQGQRLFFDDFKTSTRGFSEDPSVSQILAPPKILGVSGQYVGRLVVSSKQVTRIDVDIKEVRLSEGVSKLHISASIATASKYLGRLLVQIKITFDTGEVVPTRYRRMKKRSNKRYVPFTSNIDVPGHSRAMINVAMLYKYKGKDVTQLVAYIDQIGVVEVG